MPFIPLPLYAPAWPTLLGQFESVPAMGERSKEVCNAARMCRTNVPLPQPSEVRSDSEFSWWPSQSFARGVGSGLFCDPAKDLAGYQPVDSRQVGGSYDPPAQEALGPVGGEE